MSIPDYQTLMLPLLKLVADGKERKFRDAVEDLALQFQLNSEERAEMLPSGTAPVFDNRVGWARTYLKQAALIESPKRGQLKITDLGTQLLKENPPKINAAFLHRYPSFKEFLSRKKTKQQTNDPVVTQVDPNSTLDSVDTPEDVLASAYEAIRANLEADLLEQVKSCSPAFFERLVVDLLVKMGYGGNRQEAGKAIGQSGDEGIDGIINEDKLGLDVIYIQAKKWNSTVGRPEIQKFAGALQGQRAKKGVFITTATFSTEAREYAAKIDSKIILIDGEHLATLMFDNNIGASNAGMYEVKKLDSVYFDGE